MKALRFAPQTIWIQSESGDTYLCPADLEDALSDEKLRQLCVVESENPQNN